MSPHPSTGTRRGPLVGATVLALALASCGGPGGEVAVSLAWSFADGRGCYDADVGEVRLRGAAAIDLGCLAGTAGARATVRLPAAGGALAIAATSPSGGVLYRADLALPSPPPATLDVSLRFVGGDPDATF